MIATQATSQPQLRLRPETSSLRTGDYPAWVGDHAIYVRAGGATSMELYALMGDGTSHQYTLVVSRRKRISLI